MPDIASSFDLLISGYRLTNRERSHVTGLEATEGFDQMGTVKFTMRTSEAVPIDHVDFRLGAAVELFLSTDANVTQVFAGEIFEVTINCPDGPSVVQVVAHDLSYRLKRKGEPKRVLKKAALEEDIKALVAGHGIKHVFIRPVSNLKRLADDQSLVVGGFDADGKPGDTPWKVLSEIAKYAGLKIFVRHHTLFMVDLNTMKMAQAVRYRIVQHPGKDDLLPDDSVARVVPALDLTVKTSLMDKKSAVAALWFDINKPKGQGSGDSAGAEPQGERIEDFVIPNLRSPDFWTPGPLPTDATAVNVPVLPPPPKPKEMYWEAREDDYAAPKPGYDDDSFFSDMVDDGESVYDPALFKSLRDPGFYQPPPNAADATAVGGVRQNVPSDVAPTTVPEAQAHTAEQAKQATESRLREATERLVTTTAKVYALPAMQIGQGHDVRINDVGALGKHHSGEYTVLAVRHQIDGDGARTEVTFGRPYLVTMIGQGLIQW
jgi:hypothetical protein